MKKKTVTLRYHSMGAFRFISKSGQLRFCDKFIKRVLGESTLYGCPVIMTVHNQKPKKRAFEIAKMENISPSLNVPLGHLCDVIQGFPVTRYQRQDFLDFWNDHFPDDEILWLTARIKRLTTE
jgi:hypothetical protein